MNRLLCLIFLICFPLIGLSYDAKVEACLNFWDFTRASQSCMPRYLIIKDDNSCVFLTVHCLTDKKRKLKKCTNIRYTENTIIKEDNGDLIVDNKKITCTLVKNLKTD